MRRTIRANETITNIDYDDLDVIDAYKFIEARQLFDAGLMFQFSDPFIESRLQAWRDHFESVGSPYLIVRASSVIEGDAKYNYEGKDKVVILKERRDFRCVKCGKFVRLKSIKEKRKCDYYPECDLTDI